MMIREMQKQDIDAVLAIDHQPNGSEWSFSQLERFITQKNSCYVAEDTLADCTVLVGFIVFRQIGDEAELLHLGIASVYQRQGYGKVMFQWMLDQLAGQQVKRLFLEVRQSNQRAIRLYESFGMQFVNRRSHYYSDQEDALIYELALSISKIQVSSKA